MIIKTNKCDFLIENSGGLDGGLNVYSDSLEELQRLFGSHVVEHSKREEWKYKAHTCKQDFANALILILKEVDYLDFNSSKEIFA